MSHNASTENPRSARASCAHTRVARRRARTRVIPHRHGDRWKMQQRVPLRANPVHPTPSRQSVWRHTCTAALHETRTPPAPPARTGCDTWRARSGSGRTRRHSDASRAHAGCHTSVAPLHHVVTPACETARAATWTTAPHTLAVPTRHAQVKLSFMYVFAATVATPAERRAVFMVSVGGERVLAQKLWRAFHGVEVGAEFRSSASARRWKRNS